MAPTESDDTGVDLAMLDALRPYLAESIMVLDKDWTVRANLAPPGGLIGRGLGIGTHTLEEMHPDDAVRVMDLGVQAFETELGWEGSIVVRMHRGDGRYAPYEITAINRFDDPDIGGMVVRTREVPEGANHWPGIESHLAVTTLAELLPVGVLLLDPNGSVVFANETACGMLGREPSQLKEEGLLHQILPDDLEKCEESLQLVAKVSGRVAATLRLADAPVARVSCRFCSEGDPEVRCIAVALEDVSQAWEERRALEQRATRDALTGLLNRSTFYDELGERLASVEEGADPDLVVVFLDLDAFKSVNDRHGHLAGDQVLVDVADALTRHLPDSAIVARLGGDEFVVALSRDRSAPGAASAAVDSLGETVGAVLGPDGGTIGVSIGVAESRPGDGLRDLLHRADEAMYAEKRRRGRAAP